MSVFVWWVIPLLALVAGMAWAYRHSRPPKPAAMEESMESFSRFRQALAHQRPGQPRAARVDELPAEPLATRPKR